MECKNCNDNLRTDYSYCPNCGAKVIRNRLTVKSLWGDIIERYFNLDNTFLKTFIHLFTKPEVVTEGYIKGIRRKYLNPISYLGISITLSGFLVFLIKKVGLNINVDFWGMGTTSIAQEKLMDTIYDYQALLFILYIPMMSMAGWLCFREKKYNFSERSIIFIYSLAHYSLSIFIPSCIIILFNPEAYGIFGLTALLFMYLYTAFVIKRVSKEKGIELWSKVFIFWTLFTIMYFSLSIVIPIIMLILGTINLEDFRPRKI
ncbi:DUF3667 domain-containing protein [Maribacter thermophilus]|uniref:DUF3667 domain-containing protein n=1 Tax=Maribacter thermophilus TaxID=1197874 RepID=UPI000640C802|nr:DUF3667 domain-containing protein [Maribacter thermophilus]